MDEQITQFRSFTGANSKQAKEYLAVTRGNVDAAVNNWFDAGDEPLPEPTTKKERPRQEVPTKQTQLSHHYLELAGDVGPVYVVDQQLKIQNWTNDYQLKMDENGKSASVSGYYNWGSVRGPSKCYKGRWYYEVSLQTNGQMRVGWATEQYKPGDGDAVGSSPDSWGWEGSNKQLFHDPQNKNNKGIDGVAYGENWANGDIIGCFIDFDLREIKYSRNGRSLGVAFKNVNTINALLPCVSIKRGVKCTINFGPNFQHQPASFYGLDPCASITTRKTLTDLFETYCRKGGQDEDNLEVMGGNGLMALVSDLGGQTMNDPHLLLLCWRLRPKDFLQIKITEWLLLWSNEKLSTLNDMKNGVSRWLRDTQQDEYVFLSFYSFVFDYIRLEKGEGNTVLDKNDAKNCWDVLNIRSQFSFYDEWTKFWQTSTMKGINKDTWMMLLVFSKKIGSDVKNFDSEDYWPCVFDDFVEFLKEQKK